MHQAAIYANYNDMDHFQTIMNTFTAIIDETDLGKPYLVPPTWPPGANQVHVTSPPLIPQVRCTSRRGRWGGASSGVGTSGTWFLEGG